MVSDLVVDPTLIADEIQAGELVELVKPSLPEAITVVISTDRRRSMALLVGSPSQAYWPPFVQLHRDERHVVEFLNLSRIQTCQCLDYLFLFGSDGILLGDNRRDVWQLPLGLGLQIEPGNNPYLTQPLGT